MNRIHLDPSAPERISKLDGMTDAIHEAARKIQASAYGQGITVGDIDGGKHEIPLPVTISGKDPVKVSLAHPAGIAVQAKHGTLTRAAASCGFEVTS